MLAGQSGSGKVTLTCLDCGKSWRPGKNKIASIMRTQGSSIIPKDEDMLDLISGFKGLIEKKLIKNKFFTKKRDEILGLKNKAAKTLAKKKPDQKVIQEFLEKVSTMRELVNVGDKEDLMGRKHVKRLLKNL